MRARRHELVLCMLHVSLCCLNRVLAPSLLPPMPSPNVRLLCLMWMICYVLPLHPALLATPVLAASPVRLRLIPHAPFCRLLSLSVLSPCCHRVSRSCPASALLPVCSSRLPLPSSCSVRPPPPCLPCRRLPPVVLRCPPPLLIFNLPNGMANVSRGFVGSLRKSLRRSHSTAACVSYC